MTPVTQVNIPTADSIGSRQNAIDFIQETNFTAKNHVTRCTVAVSSSCDDY